MTMLAAFKRTVSTRVTHALLVGVNAAVFATVAGLAALTLIKNFEDTPEIRTLACTLGFTSTYCPEYGQEPIGAQHEKAEMEDRLAGIEAIERSVDQVTLFKTETDPRSGFKVTIGTVYRDLLSASPQPENHFCYITLPSGAAGEKRSLYFYTSSGRVDVSPETLRNSGVDEATLSFGRSVCKPFLIVPQP
ncbi:hypothetical protein [Novosphingobium beihaiensis]|uniref:Uncharacterized protein n=1 Tax=Novosphingobium beihaiensis TaxID=2930389 RepID=A0ABT0BS74_9SPHN|nr:hypothetical protein [Novosphingobium beihaiensis]MCJ2187897.1 hypothetical protein [Novosphingobium beihaiensis]